jgi:hypothetical protein
MKNLYFPAIFQSFSHVFPLNFWRFRQEPPRTLNGKPLVLDHLLGVSRLQDGLGLVLEYIYIILHDTWANI